MGAGPARVLRAGEPLRLEPGEVLVAPVLDAAYGPLLAVAAGAVAEIGGLLSHGAVVARELGVPCVVDVRGATRALRTGERVVVDGGSGLVTRAWRDATEERGRPVASRSRARGRRAAKALHALEDAPARRARAST